MWLAENEKWVWHLNLFTGTRVKKKYQYIFAEKNPQKKHPIWSYAIFWVDWKPVRHSIQMPKFSEGSWPHDYGWAM